MPSRKRKQPIPDDQKELGQWKLNAWSHHPRPCQYHGWIVVNEAQVETVRVRPPLLLGKQKFFGDLWWTPYDCSTMDNLYQFIQKNPPYSGTLHSIEYVLKDEPFPTDGKLLFHGTDPKSARSILKKGFLARFRNSKNGQAQGVGEYFTPFLYLALSYGKSVVVAQVLSGRWASHNTMYVCSNVNDEMVRAVLHF